MLYNSKDKQGLFISIGLLYSTLLLTLFSGCNVDEMQTVVNFTNVTMEDDFEGSTINNSLWNFDVGTGNAISGQGWGNNELQYYTDRAENITVEDGNLKITAIKESFMASGYTSARINTAGKFEQEYGRFEARIQLPWGQGLWPAFWLLGNNIDEVSWPQCGEIDIMEYRGQAPTNLLGSVHGPGYSAGNAIGKNYKLENDRFDTGFHIFGIEWGSDYINYYVDDVLYNQITPGDVNGEWVFDHPFYIIINLAVGGNFVGSPNASTVFPQTMLIDYVRVYSAEN
ncbi:glycoside hydrolase family 16 protein [bacterium]|nr:glycoside hydrolase family 16 protein [bacterium]